MPTDLVGRTSPPRRHRVTEAAVAAFLAGVPRVTTDPPPPIPPTFPVSLAPAPIPGLELPAAGLIHGAETFHYGPALKIGEEIDVTSEITGFRERAGTLFITITTRAVNGDGVLAFEAESLVLAPAQTDGPS